MQPFHANSILLVLENTTVYTKFHWTRKPYNNKRTRFVFHRSQTHFLDNWLAIKLNKTIAIQTEIADRRASLCFIMIDVPVTANYAIITVSFITPPFDCLEKYDFRNDLTDLIDNS